MKEWNKLKKDLLKNQDFRKEYLALEPEYRLAAQLIEARQAKNMSQVELAQKAGVKQAYIARVESGSTNPTFSSLSKIAKALGKEVGIS